MSVSVVSIHGFSVQRHSQIHHHSDSNNPFSRWRQKSTSVKCCKGKNEESQSQKKKNYYEFLGVSIDSNPQKIKEAYRKLQKKYHPDIAGQKGHKYTLRLNEAYKVLMREDLRREYDASIGELRMRFQKDASGIGYSSWKGPLRTQALFVDENACIGCRQCVDQAGNTFMMDEVIGCARVKVQYGDDDKQIEVAVDSCPVNCIHWVDKEELPVLEFLIRPQPQEGHGIFGQGWERPQNVFIAAKSFTKQLKQKAEYHQTDEQET